MVVVIHIMCHGVGLEYLFIETNGVEFLRALNSDLYFDISVPVLVSVLLYTHTHLSAKNSKLSYIYYISGVSELFLKVHFYSL